MHYVSLRSFLVLKLCYNCSATTKNVELCCCKTHVHWSIQAPSENTQQQGNEMGTIDSYAAFLNIRKI